MFSLFTKALDPQKVLKTFPSYHYKSLENTSLLKYTPFYDINLKYNESFDSQILLIPHDKTLPPRSRIYETSFYEYAWKKNKIEGKLSPYFVPEHHLIVAIVEMDKEKLSHQQLRSLLTFATSSSLQLAAEKGFKKPLIEYVNDYNRTATAEVEGVVYGAKCNLKLNPTLVCQINEKFYVEELLRSEGIYLKAEGFIVILVYIFVILATAALYILLSEPDPIPPPAPVQSNVKVVVKEDLGWLNTSLSKLSN